METATREAMDFDETQIERYARRPEAFDEETREKIERCLRTNAYARELLIFYRTFYATIDEQREGPEDAPPDR